MMKSFRFPSLSSRQTAQRWIATFILCAAVWGASALLPSTGRAVPATPTTIECEAFPSAILGRSVNTCFALPADYSSSKMRYPVLYLLHGLFENETSWGERG